MLRQYCPRPFTTVSYTHLDVYKRQVVFRGRVHGSVFVRGRRKDGYLGEVGRRTAPEHVVILDGQAAAGRRGPRQDGLGDRNGSGRQTFGWRGRIRSGNRYDRGHRGDVPLCIDRLYAVVILGPAIQRVTGVCRCLLYTSRCV